MAASVLRCGRVDDAASPAALVTAWLVDALSGIPGVSLADSSSESIMFCVPLAAWEAVRADLTAILSEPRFAGWAVSPE